MFEKLREVAQNEVDTMLDRLQGRVEKGKLKQSPVEEALAKVTEGIVEAKKYIEAKPDFIEKTPADQLAEYTNAWFAWGRWGLFRGPEHKALRVSLKSLLARDSMEKRFARQVWRTHMVSYFAEKLMASKRKDKAEVMEKLMAGQVVSGAEDEPREALNTGKDIDKALESDSVRVDLAAEMVKSRRHGDIAEIKDGAIFGKAFEVNAVKVIVGGSLYTFDASNLELAQKFTFKNMVLKENEKRIYAQMQNGCRGNLVIIELGNELPVTSRRPAARAAERAAKKETAPGSPEDMARVLAEWRQRQEQRDRAAKEAFAGIERDFGQTVGEFEQLLKPIHDEFYTGAEPLATAILELQDRMEAIEKTGRPADYADKIRTAKDKLQRLTARVDKVKNAVGAARGKLKIIEDHYRDNFSTYPALGQQYRERAEAPYSRLEHAWKAANVQLARINGMISRMEK